MRLTWTFSPLRIPLLPDLRLRSEEPELMDGPSPGEEREEAFRHLDVLDRVLGGTRPTVEGVERLWRNAGRPPKLSVLDAGAGSGNGGPRLLEWAGRRGIDLSVTLLDRDPSACAVAERAFAGEPRISVREGDLFALPSCAADVVTANLVLHHVPSAELPAAVLAMLRASSLGVVVNDLRRSLVAFWAIAAGTRLFSGNRLMRADGPQSVRRGFREADWERLARDTGLAELRSERRALYRWLVVLRKR